MVFKIVSVLGMLFCFNSLFFSPLAAQGISRIRGDQSRNLLGDGTNVTVAVMDSGIDDTHPGLLGNNSLGQVRLRAEGNFVPTEPANTGDDLHGHGTGVASVIVGALPANLGLAPDARYVNGRTLSQSNGFNTTDWVVNAAGFAVNNGAQIMNFSLNTFAENSTGQLNIDRMIDWAAHDRGIISAVCAGNISQSNGGDPNVRSPAGSFNSIAVGWTSASSNYTQVHNDSSIGPTSDRRIKPDVVAPGHNITVYSHNWETGPDLTSASGCSFATPHVAGLLAQQYDYGLSTGLSTNPLVMKATLLNSADKSILDKTGGAWAPAQASMVGGIFNVTSALDDQIGAGQVDGVSLYNQYSAGEQAGTVSSVGWDLNTVTDTNFVDYLFNSPLLGGTLFTTTLTWFREMTYSDTNNNLVIDAADGFNVNGALDNLDLTLLFNGNAIARSASLIDNVEHLHFLLPSTGAYTLRVSRLDVPLSGNSTTFGLAWSGITAVPEPSSLLLVAFAITVPFFRSRINSNLR